MAETIVENQICNACGEDIRKGALFCYHCGSSVAPEIIAPKADEIDDKNQAETKKDFKENGQKGSRKKIKNKAALPEEIEENPILKPAVQPGKNLKSAASLRKKSKSVQKKKVEIIWEEHEDAPNMWFVLAAILLTTFAGVIMWLALYFG